MVGSEKKEFKAHEAHLRQSPMFAAMCQGQFEEGQTCRIELPEDDLEIFQLVVRYLYRENFPGYDSIEIETCTDPNVAGNFLADIYLTAEKFQLQDLKNLTIEKLGESTNVKERPIAYLLTAQKIYGGIIVSDKAYRKFFIETASRVDKVESLDKAARQSVYQALQDGGPLALDLDSALRSRLDNELAAAQRNHLAALAKHKMEIATYKRRHQEFHAGYTRCTCCDALT
ncbi:MAG: hypothetical protein Q9218_004675 [Villophora microphyllina]